MQGSERARNARQAGDGRLARNGVELHSPRPTGARGQVRFALIVGAAIVGLVVVAVPWLGMAAPLGAEEQILPLAFPRA